MSTPHVVVKGGVWKNSEDEVLKAAVMKYGKNQWGRVSSLLVRKSAKQCKARWYEWLDPSIKKTEWTREEEEKLLHLAKLMPTQWRTIAPIIGRTATQCLEHYERLLDRAQTQDDDKEFDPESLDDAATAAMNEDPRQRRAGEVDPHPETRPARPDPVDMDEDEKEMLSEARARLANTRGKKAKRKQREKQLEEAKRLAQLQKRRELKAAGIRVKGFRARRGEIDYAREIPFQRTPVAGFYDTTEERAASKASKKDARETGKLLQSYDGKSRDEVEEAKRKQDQRRRKAFEKANLPQAINAQPRASEGPVTKRSKLALPAPQVTDLELEAISKANSSSTNLKSTPEGTSATEHLLPTLQVPDVTLTEVRTVGESWKDIRGRQVDNLKAFQDTATPLKGGENAPVEGSDFSAATPVSYHDQTPNPLATPSSSTTASVLASPISQRAITSQATEKFLSAKLERARMTKLRRELAESLLKLPEPRNLVELGLPPVNASEELNEPGDIVEDAADTKRKLEEAQDARLVALRDESLSSAARRGLPRPSPKSVELRDPTDSDDEVVQLVAYELAFLVHQDDSVLRALEKADNATGKVNTLVHLKDQLQGERKFSVSEISDAKTLIADEFNRMGSKCGTVSAADVNNRVFLPRIGRFVDPSEPELHEEAHRERHQATNAYALSLIRQVEKVENRFEILTAGLQKRRAMLLGRLRESHDRTAKLSVELKQFEEVSNLEKKVAVNRLSTAERRVSALVSSVTG